MAYVPQPQIPKEEENKFARVEPSTPFPAVPEGGGSAGTGGAGGRGAPGVGTPTQFGSNAAKLSDYLKANQDQAAEFGGQVANTLGQDYQNTMGAVDTGYGAFNQEVGHGYGKPDQNRINEAATNPAAFAQNPENVSYFRSLYNDQYQGPQNFEGSQYYGDLNNQVNQAVQNANLTNSMPGIGTFLNTRMGAKDTTEGMRTLDSALLLGNKESAKTIRDAAAPYKNLNDYLGTKAQSANQNVENAKNEANQIRQDTQNRFIGDHGVIPTFQNDLSNRVSQLQSKEGTEAQSVMDNLKTGDFSKMTAADLAELGLTKQQADDLIMNERLLQTPKNYQKIFDQNPVPNGAYPNVRPNLMNWLQNAFGNVNFDQSAYATQQNPQAAINRGNVASSDDYAKAAALQQLTGNDMSGFLNPADAGNAGKAPQSLVDYNYQGATGDSSSLYNSILDSLMPAPSGNRSQWDTMFRDIANRANSQTGGLSTQNADNAALQILEMKQQSGGELSQEEQDFINYYKNRDEAIGNHGYGAL